jgi:hypothetical protein
MFRSDAKPNPTTSETIMTSLPDEIGDLSQKELAHLFMDTV